MMTCRGFELFAGTFGGQLIGMPFGRNENDDEERGRLLRELAVPSEVDTARDQRRLLWRVSRSPCGRKGRRPGGAPNRCHRTDAVRGADGRLDRFSSGAHPEDVRHGVDCGDGIPNIRLVPTPDGAAQPSVGAIRHDEDL